MEILLPKDIFKILVVHSIHEYPFEACGILGGEMGDKNINIKSYFITKNVAPNPYREYLIDPLEEIKIFRYMNKVGQNFVGVYHSHPDGDEYLSDKDKEDMLSNICYLIFSVRFNNPVIKLKAYLKKNEDILDLPIRIF
ncbi:M67 family metallopeptidase [Dictyoglomus thermophilum]|uniref:Mov34/MPN/PAD-1 family n=1 Tax=Dictyoglomus thermophilum (strain ATCC 35947 / DSM 3960 / H-6-12) TaxID=309799 RepID=B5YAB0_DICT6|nr:M67 family metallopeptidase [Dictyoglomus thermophilum]ACI19963.1 Mov34/MPN/PAD-1 family [Dictyoglomus thermophilum H-6-12]